MLIAKDANYKHIYIFKRNYRDYLYLKRSNIICTYLVSNNIKINQLVLNESTDFNVATIPSLNIIATKIHLQSLKSIGKKQ